MKRWDAIAALIWLSSFVATCDNATKYPTVLAEVGDIRDVVPAIGTLRAQSQVEVRADTPGRVMAVLVEPNSPVRKGQILARIQPDRLALDVEAAQAEHRSAQAAVAEASALAEKAARYLANRRSLAEKGFISPAALNDAEATARAAEATLRRTNADAARAAIQVRTATGSLGDVLVRSPFDGFVMSRSVEPGQMVTPNAEEPLFVIASETDTLLIEAQVAEPDIARIPTAARIVFAVEAYPREQFTGRIRHILRSPQKDRNFVSYPVLIETSNSDGKLLPGMTASVEFIHADVRQVLRAPVEAIYFMPDDYRPELPPELLRRISRYGPVDEPGARAAAEDGLLFARNQRRLFILKHGKPVMRAVSIGAQSSQFIEITDGLEEGEIIITGAPEEERAGAG